MMMIIIIMRVTTIGRQRQYHIVRSTIKFARETLNSSIFLLIFHFPLFLVDVVTSASALATKYKSFFVHFLIAMHTYTTHNIFILLILLTPPHHSLFSLYSFYSDVMWWWLLLWYCKAKHHHYHQ